MQDFYIPFSLAVFLEKLNAGGELKSQSWQQKNSWGLFCLGKQNVSTVLSLRFSYCLFVCFSSQITNQKQMKIFCLVFLYLQYIAGMAGNLLMLCEIFTFFDVFAFVWKSSGYEKTPSLDWCIPGSLGNFEPISLGKRQTARSFGGGFTGDLDEWNSPNHSWDLYIYLYLSVESHRFQMISGPKILRHANEIQVSIQGVPCHQL